MVAVTHSPSHLAPVAAPHPLDLQDLHAALREGWQDFLALRGDIVFAGLIYPVVALLAAVFALNLNRIAFVFPMAAAFTLLGPMMAIGFYELARRRGQGLEAGWSHFLDPLRGPSRWQIAGLAAALTLLAIGWMVAARAIYGATLGPLAPGDVGTFLSQLVSTPEGWRMILLGNLVGFGFALVALTVSVLSFPMLVDRPVHAIDAVEASVRLTLSNPRIVLRWGLYVAALLALACIPLFLGLAIALPVLGYASWHLYERASQAQTE